MRGVVGAERSMHEEGAISLDDLGAAQRKDPRQCHVQRVEARDLRKGALRPPHHAAGFDVVLRRVPGAHQAAVGEAAAEMATPPTHPEQPAVCVPDDMVCDSDQRARWKIGCGSNAYLGHLCTLTSYVEWMSVM